MEQQPWRSPRVCIVGAGLSGLCACRHLVRMGLDPVVLEARGAIGGVWTTASVSITKLQTPKLGYQFSDFPWPDGIPEFPSGEQVRQYLRDYAQHYELLDRIRFNTKVLSIRKLGLEDANIGVWGEDHRAWEVLTERTFEHTKERMEFNFVILCIGRFGDVPNIPTFPQGKGPLVFKGRVMHSLEYSQQESIEYLARKHVVVVGFSKSALDIAAEAAIANAGNKDYTCKLLVRTPHWLISQWRFFGISGDYLYGTRFSEMLTRKPGQGYMSSLLTTMLLPVRWAISKFSEIYLRWTQPLSRHGLIPQHSFYEQVSSCKLSVLPEGFFDRVKEGRIRICRSQRWHFWEQGVVLEDGRHVKADLVIFATGFKGELKLKSLLLDEYSAHLQALGDVVPLYRGVVHPRIPNLALLGYQEDLSNLRGSETGARWLSYYLTAKFKLPDTKIMEEDATAWVEYMKKTSRFYNRACTFSAKTWQIDELCRDMGWNPRRKKSWFQELFTPYSNMDYVSCIQN